MTFRLVYIPRGINAPRPCDIRTRDIPGCLHAYHAAIRAAGFERRTGARVLTIKERS